MATNNKLALSPCIELYKNGIQKLETFFKIAAGKEETAFMELDPQEETIRLNSIDPSHISQTIHVITNEDEGDFEIHDIDKVFQFNVSVRDFNKLLTLNADKDIKIYPDLDNENSFDGLRIKISENNISLSEIFLPIHEAGNVDLFESSEKFTNELITKTHNTVVIVLELPFFKDLLKESEIFMNERLRWNVTIRNKQIESLSIETFDSDTDKTRRIKINLYLGLHFNTKKVNVPDNEKHTFSTLISLPDLKRNVVDSKIFTHVQLVISEDKPFCILYDGQPGAFSLVENTLSTFLAPITREEDTPKENQEE